MLRRLALVLAFALPLSAASRWISDRAGAAVKWEPWGSAAVARAKKENKPLFLSIGFASSWEAKRMHDEAFADPVNAKSLNFEFVPVLVDAIEHPELAREYGEIANVIVTPSLDTIAKAGIVDAGELRQLLAMKSREPEPPPAPRPRRVFETDDAAVEAVVDAIAKTYDAEHGGFGGVPRTAHADAIAFLMRYAERANHAGIRTLVRDTLTRLARLPVRDQLGGGFHRATRDAAWRDPYLEKLLIDQAELANLYLDAWQLTKDPEYEMVVRTTLDYVIRDLPRPGGGFDAAQDAYSLVPVGGKPVLVNGAFYRWDVAELAPIVGETDAKKIAALYGDGPLPLRSTAIDPALAEPLAKVLDKRQRRPAPFREQMLVAGWNGLTIAALARAGAVFNERRYVDAAGNAARAVMKTLWNEQKKTLSRAEGVDALAEDYAMLANGLVELFDATSDPVWLEQATRVQQRMDQLFWDASAGNYGTDANANAIAVANLLRLASLSGTQPTQPAMIFTSYGARLREDGARVPEIATAYLDSLRGAQLLVLSGDPRKKTTIDAVATAHARFEPLRTVVFLPPKGIAHDKLVRVFPFMSTIAFDPENVLTYVCSGGECRRQ